MVEKRKPAVRPYFVKHQVAALIKRGLAALPETLRARELEAVGNMATVEGILRELEHVAVVQTMIVEAGFDYIQRLLAEGKNPWTSRDGAPEAMLRDWGSYVNGCVRTLTILSELRKNDATLELDYEARLEDLKNAIP